MSMFAKIMVIVNLILAVVFLAAAGTLHSATENWKAKHVAVSEEKVKVEKIKDENIAARDVQIKSLTDNVSSLRERAAAAEANQKTLADGNANLNTALNAAKAQAEAQTTNINELTKTVTDLNTTNNTLRNDLATAQAEKKQREDENGTLREAIARETARAENAEKSLASAEANNKALNDNLDRVSTELAAYRKAYPPLGNSVSMKDVKGVVSASDAKADVHILNVGSKDGVEIGYEFIVYRGDKYVATLVVDSVQANLSSARVKAGSKKSDVQAGDGAATRL